VLVAGILAVWVSASAVAVITLRPELAAATHAAERAAAAAVPVIAPDLAPDLAAGPSAAASPAIPPPRRPAVPAGWLRHADSQGFSINLPDGWAQDYRSVNQVRFTAPGQSSGPGQGVTVVIAFTTTPKGDQYADWQAQAAWKAETDPGYQLIGIRRVAYRGYNCAEWEFLDSDQGQLTHYLDHGFIPVPGAQAYSIELVAPAGEWASVRARLWDELLASFSPARLRA
jgi:hypothetical protein